MNLWRFTLMLVVILKYYITAAFLKVYCGHVAVLYCTACVLTIVNCGTFLFQGPLSINHGIFLSLRHWIMSRFGYLALSALETLFLVSYLHPLSHLKGQAIMHNMIYRQNTLFCVIVHKSTGLVMYLGYCKLLIAGCSM